MYYGLLALVFLSLNDNHVVQALTVRDYGSLQISMLRHGEKYATNRPCYAYEDVTPWYHGMTHIRGPNDKTGTTRVRVDCPVKIFLAVDSRYPYVHGTDYVRTSDYLYLGGCHKPRVKFYIYESKDTYGPGLVFIFNSPASRMFGVFLRDSRLIRAHARLKVTSLPLPWTTSMVREGEKFSTDRDCYTMVDIPPKFYGLLHLRGPNDKTSPIRFHVNVPTVVYVAIDTRYPNPLDSSFAATGEKIVHAGCHPRTDFAVYKSSSLLIGDVTINLSATRMLAVFLKPEYDNTFKSGVY